MFNELTEFSSGAGALPDPLVLGLEPQVGPVFLTLVIPPNPRGTVDTY